MAHERDPQAPDTDTDTDAVAAGMAALLAGDWGTARDRFADAIKGGDEPPVEALEGFAAASWWLDDVDAAIDARERSYAVRRANDQTPEAALLAALLAWDHGALRGATAVANGWLARARRLTAQLPPAPEHAWLPLIEASFHLDTDAETVLRLSTEALAQAEATGGLDVEMTARTLRGLALVSLGQVEEGTRLLDEGTAAATSGELHDPIAIGSCCCNMIIACERSRDFERAAQWCERLEAFAERSGQRPLLALCRAHHGTVLTMRGEWTAAQDELRWATGTLSTLRPPLAGYARARFAELRRRQGRARDARALLGQAGGHVLVWLVRAHIAVDEEDDVTVLDCCDRYLRSFTGGQSVEAAPALEVLATTLARADEVDRARHAHEELDAIAASIGTPALEGSAWSSRGWVGMAEGEPATAARAFEEAIERFDLVQMPFEAAGARLGLARALAACDRREAAIEQARAALTGFEALGARRALTGAEAALVEIGGTRARGRHAGLTRREVEVLALVADGLSNPEIAERLVVSEHTVHRHVSNIFTRLDVSSRAAAVAVAAEHDLLP